MSLIRTNQIQEQTAGSGVKIGSRMVVSDTGVTQGQQQPCDPGTVQIDDSNFMIFSRRLRLSGVERLTIKGSGHVRIL